MVKIWSNGKEVGEMTLEKSAVYFCDWIDRHFQHGEPTQHNSENVALVMSPNGDSLRIEFESKAERLLAMGGDNEG